ncbi:MAG: cysteine hydrolase [Paracoccaceae bacterium]|nr:cysteine hydrolase [Paracoccaceae bacterium]MDE3239806.1 cysteine hydrolase [Paracoccaceae bacterium]
MKALVIVDMQMEMLHRMEAGRDHVNPAAPERIAELAGAFRREGFPVIHVRHCASDAGLPFHPEAPGFQPMPCDLSEEGEAVFLKRASSAFSGTDLERHLRERGITDLVVTGAVAGFCVNSTVRAGSDLGFKMTVVRDAVIGFDEPSSGIPARRIFDVTMALLEADFAKVCDTSDVIAR